MFSAQKWTAVDAPATPWVALHSHWKSVREKLFTGWFIGVFISCHARIKLSSPINKCQQYITLTPRINSLSHIPNTSNVVFSVFILKASSSCWIPSYVRDANYFQNISTAFHPSSSERCCCSFSWRVWWNLFDFSFRSLFCLFSIFSVTFCYCFLLFHVYIITFICIRRCVLRKGRKMARCLHTYMNPFISHSSHIWRPSANFLTFYMAISHFTYLWKNS